MPVGSIRPPYVSHCTGFRGRRGGPIRSRDTETPGKKSSVFASPGSSLAETLADFEEVLPDAVGVRGEEDVDCEPHRSERDHPARELGAAEEQAEQHRDHKRGYCEE